MLFLAAQHSPVTEQSPPVVARAAAVPCEQAVEQASEATRSMVCLLAAFARPGGAVGWAVAHPCRPVGLAR